MKEIELKFRIPADRLAAVRRALAGGAVEVEPLHAAYHDTPQRALARRGIALRVRREGRRWIQTAKALGDDALTRLEHEVVLGSRRPPPDHRPDPDLHRPHAALHARLLQALADEGPQALQAQYRTDVRRTRRVVRVGRSRVEIALDEGAILAGRPEQRIQVRELEFELVSGDARDLITLAERWVTRHGLWLDPRSKAERGDHLAQGEPSLPPAKVATVPLDPAASPAQALAAGMQAVLAAVARNAARLADGDEAADPAHTDLVHQLRVALRRGRTLLKVFGRWWDPSDDGESAAAGPTAQGPEAREALEVAMADAFRALGHQRDQDVLRDLLGGPLEAGGYAGLAGTVESNAPPAPEVVRSQAFARLLLAWMRMLIEVESQASAAAQAAVPGVEPTPASATPALAAGSAAPEPDALRAAVQRALRRLWKRWVPQAERFAELDEEHQHTVRKQAKRLRYALDFCAPLLPRKRVEAFSSALAKAQDALGAYTDVLMAQSQLQQRPLDDAAAAYARGWLSSRRQVALDACERPIRRLLKVRPPWA